MGFLTQAIMSPYTLHITEITPCPQPSQFCLCSSELYITSGMCWLSIVREPTHPSFPGTLLPLVLNILYSLFPLSPRQSRIAPENSVSIREKKMDHHLSDPQT